MHQYQLQSEGDQQPVATLDMTVATRLTTYLNTSAHLDISSLFPTVVDQPQDWSPETTHALLAETQDALGVLATQLPPPTIVTIPGMEVSKAVMDLSPEESLLLSHIPHTSGTRDEKAWVTFQQPATEQVQQMAASTDLAQASADLAQVVSFFSQANQYDPLPQLVLTAAEEG